MNRHEVKQPARKVKNGEATGPDEIPAEVWKAFGEEGINVVWELIKKIHVNYYVRGGRVRLSHYTNTTVMSKTVGAIRKLSRCHIQ